LKDEVAVLKGEKKRPVFKPSRMNEDAGKPDAVVDVGPDKGEKKTRRAGSDKRSKTDQLKVDDLVINPEEAIPPGSRFKGYQDFTVQDVVITTKNTRYRLARYQAPDGRYLIGKLPKELQGCHFGPNLVAYVLYQHHHCHVTQPLLHEQLREWGVNISAGQVNAILLDGKTPFHDEKDALLAAGLALSAYVTVDDSGARHQGNNGYVTHIGNQYFASFHSSMSKSRVNFQLPRTAAGRADGLPDHGERARLHESARFVPNLPGRLAQRRGGGLRQQGRVGSSHGVAGHAHASLSQDRNRGCPARQPE
jgi:hypothetical protein